MARVQQVIANSYGHFILWFIFTVLFATSGIATCGPTGFYRYASMILIWRIIRAVFFRDSMISLQTRQSTCHKDYAGNELLCFYTAGVFAIGFGLGAFLKDFVKIGFIREVWMWRFDQYRDCRSVTRLEPVSKFVRDGLEMLYIQSCGVVPLKIWKIPLSALGSCRL